MKQTTASVCTIGDEILIGQIIDTNSSVISQKLNGIGVKVTRMISIGDDRKQIIDTLENELSVNDIVIVTGGLGPTRDDITKAALAELSGAVGYRQDARQLEIIHEILRSRGLDVLDVNIAQASVPDSCEVILNRRGTAPIMVFPFAEDRFGHRARLYSMPGVPFETEAALPDVVADIRENFGQTDITHRTLMTFGLAESALSKKIEAWETALPEQVHLAYLPNPLTGVRLRLSIYGGDSLENEAELESQIAGLREILGKVIYAESDSNLQTEIGRLLLKSGKTVSAAESCTGGKISELMTSVSGCSAYYLGSVTSYAIPVKEKVLGVPAETIEKFGVVSAEVAAAMAEGVRRLTGSDYAVSTTGIAGPGGGSGTKPVGLVWVGVASGKGTKTASFTYRNDRRHNIERFAAAALHLLWETISEDCNNLSDKNYNKKVKH